MKYCINDYFDIIDDISSKDTEELLSILYDELECEYEDRHVMESIIDSQNVWNDSDDLDGIMGMMGIHVEYMYINDYSIYVYTVYKYTLKLKYQDGIDSNNRRYYKRLVITMMYKLLILYEDNKNIFNDIDLNNILDMAIKDLDDNFNVSIDKNENLYLLDIEKNINNRKELAKCFFMM